MLSLLWILPVILKQRIVRNREYFSKIGYEELSMASSLRWPYGGKTQRSHYSMESSPKPLIQSWVCLKVMQGLQGWSCGCKTGEVLGWMCYFSTFSGYRRGSSLLEPPAHSWLVVSMPVEIPPNCWCIPNKWVQFSKATTAAEVKQWGRIIPATKQADQRREKLPIGDDQQVGRSNQFISESNVNRASQSPQ